MLRFVEASLADEVLAMQICRGGAGVEYNPQYAERTALWVVSQKERAFPPAQLEAEYNHFKSSYVAYASDDVKAAFLEYEAEHRQEMMQCLEEFTTRVDKVCSLCGYAASKKCSECKLEYYCSDDCQGDDWARHKCDVCLPRLIANTLPSAAAAASESPREQFKTWITWPHSGTALRSVPHAEIKSAIDIAASSPDFTDPDTVKIRTASLRFANPICARENCDERSRARLKVCSRCCLVFYCSKGCQRTDWGEHNRRCGNVHGPAEGGKLRLALIHIPEQ